MRRRTRQKKGSPREKLTFGRLRDKGSALKLTRRSIQKSEYERGKSWKKRVYKEGGEVDPKWVTAVVLENRDKEAK